jgi:hypothetical protein
MSGLNRLSQEDINLIRDVFCVEYWNKWFDFGLSEEQKNEIVGYLWDYTLENFNIENGKIVPIKETDDNYFQSIADQAVKKIVTFKKKKGVN